MLRSLLELTGAKNAPLTLVFETSNPHERIPTNGWSFVTV